MLKFRRTPASALTSLSLAVALAACAGDEGPNLDHSFDVVHAESGEEIAYTCQSWTLHNDKELYVTQVEQTNDGAWHHSNWFYVPEDAYPGKDGSWDCGDREFNEADAALRGGVFFAQSTQSLTDVQQFPEGAALRIPPRYKIVGNIHVLNTTKDPIDTAIHFKVTAVDKEEVETELYPASFTNLALDLEPRAQSRFVMNCPIGESFENKFDKKPDFNIYYVLPHYHEMGNFFKLEAVDKDGNARTVMETEQRTGDPLGKTLSPVFKMKGEETLRLTCGYENPRSERVYYGIGDQEMCVFLAYIDAPISIAGVALDNKFKGEEDGIFMNDSRCGVIGL